MQEGCVQSQNVGGLGRGKVVLPCRPAPSWCQHSMAFDTGGKSFTTSLKSNDSNLARRLWSCVPALWSVMNTDPGFFGICLYQFLVDNIQYCWLSQTAGAIHSFLDCLIPFMIVKTRFCLKCHLCFWLQNVVLVNSSCREVEWCW